MRLTSVASIALVAVSACGSSSTSGSAAPSQDSGTTADAGGGGCAQVAAAVCKALRACPSKPGSPTATSNYNFPTGTQNVTTTLSDCEAAFLRRQCDSAQTDAYYATCASTLDGGGATCAKTGDLQFLGLPQDCSGLLECKGKPGICNGQ